MDEREYRPSAEERGTRLLNYDDVNSGRDPRASACALSMRARSEVLSHMVFDAVPVGDDILVSFGTSVALLLRSGERHRAELPQLARRLALVPFTSSSGSWPFALAAHDDASATLIALPFLELITSKSATVDASPIMHAVDACSAPPDSRCCLLASSSRQLIAWHIIHRSPSTDHQKPSLSACPIDGVSVALVDSADTQRELLQARMLHGERNGYDVNGHALVACLLGESMNAMATTSHYAMVCLELDLSKSYVVSIVFSLQPVSNLSHSILSLPPSSSQISLSIVADDALYFIHSEHEAQINTIYPPKSFARFSAATCSDAGDITLALSDSQCTTIQSLDIQAGTFRDVDAPAVIPSCSCRLLRQTSTHLFVGTSHGEWFGTKLGMQQLHHGGNSMRLPLSRVLGLPPIMARENSSESLEALISCSGRCEMACCKEKGPMTTLQRTSIGGELHDRGCSERVDVPPFDLHSVSLNDHESIIAASYEAAWCTCVFKRSADELTSDETTKAWNYFVGDEPTLLLEQFIAGKAVHVTPSKIYLRSLRDGSPLSMWTLSDDDRIKMASHSDAVLVVAKQTSVYWFTLNEECVQLSSQIRCQHEIACLTAVKSSDNQAIAIIGLWSQSTLHLVQKGGDVQGEIDVKRHGQPRNLNCLRVGAEAIVAVGFDGGQVSMWTASLHSSAQCAHLRDLHLGGSFPLMIAIVGAQSQESERGLLCIAEDICYVQLKHSGQRSCVTPVRNAGGMTAVTCDHVGGQSEGMYISYVALVSTGSSVHVGRLDTKEAPRTRSAEVLSHGAEVLSMCIHKASESVLVVTAHGPSGEYPQLEAYHTESLACLHRVPLPGNALDAHLSSDAVIDCSGTRREVVLLSKTEGCESLEGYAVRSGRGTLFVFDLIRRRKIAADGRDELELKQLGACGLPSPLHAIEVLEHEARASLLLCGCADGARLLELSLDYELQHHLEVLTNSIAAGDEITLREVESVEDAVNVQTVWLVQTPNGRCVTEASRLSATIAVMAELLGPVYMLRLGSGNVREKAQLARASSDKLQRLVPVHSVLAVPEVSAAVIGVHPSITVVVQVVQDGKGEGQEGGEERREDGESTMVPVRCEAMNMGFLPAFLVRGAMRETSWEKLDVTVVSTLGDIMTVSLAEQI